MNKDLDYYLNLPWSYHINWSDEDGCYVASIQELKGCMSHGDTPEEAIAIIRDALVSYITCSLHFNDNIPEPIRLGNFKGKIAYRTTKERHYELAKASKLKGISINDFIDDAVERRLADMI